jgi:hypothetical protein
MHASLLRLESQSSTFSARQKRETNQRVAAQIIIVVAVDLLGTRTGRSLV